MESQGSQVESQLEEKSKTEEKSRDDQERDEMRLYARINYSSDLSNFGDILVLLTFLSPSFDVENIVVAY